MTTVSPLLEELRRMPADRLEETAEYITTLLHERRERRERMIDATAGTLSAAEGDALEAALAECETLDESSW